MAKTNDDDREPCRELQEMLKLPANLEDWTEFAEIKPDAINPESYEPYIITDENAKEMDHLHPEVSIRFSNKCPVCRSYMIAWSYSFGESDEHGSGVLGHGRKVICPNCKKMTLENIHMPDNDNPIMFAVPFEPNWVRCPNCRRGFKLDSYDWTGERHVWCGQRLFIGEAEEGDNG